MKKIAINTSYDGEFLLSHAAIMEYAKRKGINVWGYVNEEDCNCDNIDYNKYVEFVPTENNYDDECRIHYFTKPLENNVWDGRNNEDYYHPWNIARDDTVLIEILEEMGDKSVLPICKLKIIEIPDDVKWYIGGNSEFGREEVVEEHRTWK